MLEHNVVGFNNTLLNSEYVCMESSEQGAYFQVYTISLVGTFSGPYRQLRHLGPKALSRPVHFPVIARGIPAPFSLCW